MAAIVVKAGLSLARHIKKLKAQLAKIGGQKSTPIRQDRKVKIQAALDKLQKQTKAPSPKKKPQTLKQELTADETARGVERAKTAKQWKAMPKKDRGEAWRLSQAQIKDKLSELGGGTGGGRRSMPLTPAGEKLAFSKNPADHEKLLRSLELKGERSPFIRHGYDAPLAAKGRLSPKEYKSLSTAEKIEYKRNRPTPELTREQAARAMRGKEMPFDPEDIATGFGEFKKGGMTRKKYQSTKKYGGKEYVYMGGGLVKDIMHFKKKRGR